MHLSGVEMVKELFKSFKGHLEDRISNPILGAFCLSWVIFNWKPIFILLFGQSSIEEKIAVIELNQMSLNAMLWMPLGFTVFYLLILPWFLLGVQIFQEKANGKRKINQLGFDTQYLSEKINFVRAESELDAVRLEQDLHRDFEIKSRDMDLEREKAKHDFEIERDRRHMEFEFEERKAQYEETRQSRENELEHEKNMRQLKINEKRRRDELELESYKAESQRNKM
jgi:hypothetical protein